MFGYLPFRKLQRLLFKAVLRYCYSVILVLLTAPPNDPTTKIAQTVCAVSQGCRKCRHRTTNTGARQRTTSANGHTGLWKPRTQWSVEAPRTRTKNMNADSADLPKSSDQFQNAGPFQYVVLRRFGRSIRCLRACALRISTSQEMAAITRCLVQKVHPEMRTAQGSRHPAPAGRAPNNPIVASDNIWCVSGASTGMNQGQGPGQHSSLHVELPYWCPTSDIRSSLVIG